MGRSVYIDGTLVEENTNCKEPPKLEFVNLESESINAKPESVYHPNHYTNGKYECLEVMKDVFGPDMVQSFCICNAFKYIWRHKLKHGSEDIEKAHNYLGIYLEMEGEKDE